MLGRGETGATIGAAAPQRRVARDQGPRNEGDQRSRPYRATPATGSGTMIQPPQPRRPDVPAIPVTAYVVNAGSGTVTPITTATNTAGHPITTGSDPWAIAITPDGTTAYVDNAGSGTVTPIAAATDTAGTPIPTGYDSDPDAIAITPDGATAYVANEHSGTVTPIATATNTAGPPITVGSAPWAIAISPDGTTAYVANSGSGTVTPITTATNTAGPPITVGSGPWAIAITPDGTTAYVANHNSGTVTPITTATNTAGTPITTGTYPDAIAITITPPAAASHEIKGYGGKCADDTGNSSAVLAKVQIWSCVNDASQQWSFTGGELKHGSLCMNDQGNAGNGGHVILWSCNGASNEVWEHTSSGEYMLKSNGLCLDDPADSTRNGTQLDVYRCHNGSNQHWSLP